MIPPVQVQLQAALVALRERWPPRHGRWETGPYQAGPQTCVRFIGEDTILYVRLIEPDRWVAELWHQRLGRLSRWLERDTPVDAVEAQVADLSDRRALWLDKWLAANRPVRT